ncbi:MAG: hypothetical protein R3Y56_01205 [Akkermansia sp.]
MSEKTIICKATADTMMRFGVLLLALWGFGFYFLYDAQIGYQQKNEAYFSYQAFAKGGEKAPEMSEDQWKQKNTPTTPLIEASVVDGVLCVVKDKEGKSTLYPLPTECQSVNSMPEEFLHYQVMRKGWNDAWMDYSARMRFELKPADPHDAASIAEQWIASGVTFALSFILLFFTVRTAKRQMSIAGTKLTVAGQQFDIADIERIDMRQWGAGYKGSAIFTVKGKKVKADGMTYGGFAKKDDQPAERFMQAVLAQYQGELIEYAKDESATKA